MEDKSILQHHEDLMDLAKKTAAQMKKIIRPGHFAITETAAPETGLPQSHLNSKGMTRPSD